MAIKKYLSLDRLEEYDELIKAKIDSGDASTLASAKSYADGLASGKSDAGHVHDDRYYTESEIDAKLSTVNTSITNITSGTVVVKEAEHAGTADSATTATTAGSAATADSATKATQDGNGKVISSTYETKADASSKLAEAKSYTDTVASGKADTGHKHDDLYDAKGAADGALASAKTYADNAATKVKNDLLNGAGTAYDTLKELGDLIDDNQDAIGALEAVASGKADAEHTHAISEVSGLQSALDGKADSSHGTHVTYSTTAPVMDGTASAGSAATIARSDHKHPTDTSRASQADLDALEAVVSGKADESHSHTITASASDDDVVILTGANGTNKVTYTASHATSGVTAGTYKSVTVNSYGHVTAGTNPTTLAGYGITDAASKTHSHSISEVTNLQTTLNNASSAISANTSSISGHTTRIAALEAKVGDGFEEITSAEIQALFAQ